ncbi:MAG: acyl carrier protein [Devosia sp.]|nr:acyl carrier protein [Devosia sp.]
MHPEAGACAIVAEALGQQEAVEITDDMITLTAWDSLAHMRLMLGIEAALGRSLTADEIASITSVRDVARLLDTAGQGS